MTGGTLILSRATNLHNFYKTHLEEIGFKNIFITDVDRDALYNVIFEFNPNILMIEACYYKCATPYMMSELLKVFPELNIVVVNLYDYPEEQAKWFIISGVKSYISMIEGIEEFYIGLRNVRDGNNYVSPNVVNCLGDLEEMPEIKTKITERENQVLKLLCNGRKEEEIVNILHISINTVHRHRQSLYNLFHVENRIQLFWAALSAGKVRIDKSFYFANEGEILIGGIL